MINQFDYMKMREIMATVFHDDMDIPLQIIKHIQDYQNDDEFVPKITQCYSAQMLEHTIRFIIDSATMSVNGVPVMYTISLYVSGFMRSDYGYDYKLKAEVCANPEDNKTLEQSGYIYGTFDTDDMLKYLESRMYEEVMCQMVGAIAWKIQRLCMDKAKNYVKAVCMNDDAINNLPSKERLNSVYGCLHHKPVPFGISEDGHIVYDEEDKNDG